MPCVETGQFPIAYWVLDKGIIPTSTLKLKIAFYKHLFANIKLEIGETRPLLDSAVRARRMKPT